MFLASQVILMPNGTTAVSLQDKWLVLLLTYVIIVGLSGLVTTFALRRYVFDRIAAMNVIVGTLRNTASQSIKKVRVPLEYNDELTQLGRDVNVILDTMDKAYEDLHHLNTRLDHLNTRLESRVEERTRKLLEANQQLAAEVGEHRQTQVKLTQARDQAVAQPPQLDTLQCQSRCSHPPQRHRPSGGDDEEREGRLPHAQTSRNAR